MRRIDRQREDEAHLLAEYAHKGERIVSVLRLMTIFLLGGAAWILGQVGGEAREPSAMRQVVIASWLIFSIGVFAVLRRQQRFTPRAALLVPIAFMLVDYSVLVSVTLLSQRGARPEIGTAVLTIVLSYSVARFSSLHVLFSAVLSIAGMLILALSERWFTARSAGMVIASYVCLATMVWWANRQVRQMFIDVRRRQNLVKLLPPEVARRIIEEGGRSLEPTKRTVTILFSDIRDFTALSQRMDPRGVLELLGGYFEQMSEIVKGHDGMLNKFIGDGLLAVWGVPDAREDHALRAVKAALDMRKRLADLNAVRVAAGAAPLRIGVGLHSGEVAAGMLGGKEQAEYTVIGDAVNLASRIEGLTKKVGADVVVSEATWALCGGALKGERIGEEMVKGRDEPVVVYRVDGLEPRG